MELVNLKSYTLIIVKKGFAPIVILVVTAVLFGGTVFVGGKVFKKEPTESTSESRLLEMAEPSTSPSPSTYELPSQSPNLKAAVKPLSEPAKRIKWKTNSVLLEASDLTISANGKTFSANVSNICVRSDPGSASYTTLEVTWVEHDAQMRMYIYFASKDGRWNVSEVRTYNGKNPGDWIMYDGFEGNKLGEALIKSSFDLNSKSVASYTDSGKVHFSNIKLLPSFGQGASASCKDPYPQQVETIEVSDKVKLNSVEPNSGNCGTKIKLKGSGFGSKKTYVNYKISSGGFNGVATSSYPDKWEDSEIETAIPTGVTPNTNVELYVLTDDNLKSNRLNFSVKNCDGPPLVTSN